MTVKDTAVTATIAAAGTVSTAIDLRGARGFGFALPATFTGTAITFQVSHDNVTFQALNDDSGAVSMTVAQGKSYTAPRPDSTSGGPGAWPYVKLVSGSTEGAERSIVVVREK